MSKYDHLVNFDLKDFKAKKKQEQAEKQFSSKLSSTNRKRTRKKKAYNGTGYSYISVDGKMVLEHRHMMEQHLGRKLMSHEGVYFKDGNKENITLDNLQLGIKPGKYKTVVCPHCENDIFSIDLRFDPEG